MKRMLSTLLALCLLLTLTPAALGAEAPKEQSGTWTWTWDESTNVHTFTLGDAVIQNTDFMTAVDAALEDSTTEGRTLAVRLSGNATITDPPKEDGGQTNVKTFLEDAYLFDLGGNILTLDNMHLGASMGAAVQIENGTIQFTNPAGENAPAVPVLSARKGGSLLLSKVTVTRSDGGVVVSTTSPVEDSDTTFLQIVDCTLNSTAEDMGDGVGLNAMIVATGTEATLSGSTLIGSSPKYPTISVNGGKLTVDANSGKQSSITATAHGVAAAIVRDGELHLKNESCLIPGEGAYAYGGRTNSTLHLYDQASASPVELRAGDQILDENYTGGTVMLTCTGGQGVGDLLVTGCASEGAAQKFQSSAQNTVGLFYEGTVSGSWSVAAAVAPVKADTYTVTQDEHDRYTVVGTYQDGGSYVVTQEEPSYGRAIGALFGDVQGTGGTINLGGDLTIVGTPLGDGTFPTTGVGEGWITWNLQSHTLNLKNICMLADYAGTLTVKNGTVAFTGDSAIVNGALFGAQMDGKMILENVTATRSDGGRLLGAYPAESYYEPNEIISGASVTATSCTLDNDREDSIKSQDGPGSNAIAVGTDSSVSLIHTTVGSGASWAVANVSGTLNVDADSSITSTEETTFPTAAVSSLGGTVHLAGGTLTADVALRDNGRSQFYLSGNAQATTIELAGPSVVDATGFTGSAVALTYTGSDVLADVPLISGCANEETAKKFTLTGGDGVNLGYEQQPDGSWAAVAAATPLDENVTEFSAGTVYSVSSKAELARLAELVNAGNSGEGSSFALTDNIDLTGNESDQWTPIGKGDSENGGVNHFFMGTFDGGGHTVRGLYINTLAIKDQGLFGCVGKDGIVRALTVAGQITAVESTGGVVGSNNGLVDRCVSEVTVTGRDYTGGVVGYNSPFGSIRACVNKGNVSAAGEEAGGIVGKNWGTITDCVNTGAVSGGPESRWIGGIAGINGQYGYASTLTCCMSLGPVSGHRDVGGIVGGGDQNAAQVTGCVALGLTVHAGSDAGRIAGPNTAGTLSGNFARSDLALTGGAMTGETAVQTGIDGESLSLTVDWQKTAFTSWDFSNTWNEGEGDRLPTLKSLGEQAFNVPYPAPAPPIPDSPPSGGSSGSSSESKPSVTTGEGGSVKADSKGNVTIIPDEGWCVATITVNGKTVELPENGVLTGLESNDKVAVTFERIPLSPIYTLEQFTDLDPDAWYYDGMTYVLAKGIFRGTSDTTFSPDASMSRAMLFTVLYRMSGEKKDASDGTPWYASALTWAVENGISDGSNPDAEISREQLATMLWRYAGEPVSSGDLTAFSDGETAAPWSAQALAWAVGQDILSGKGGGVLDPTGKATRAQVAAMLMRFLTNQEK